MKPPEMTADKLHDLECQVANPVLDAVHTLEGTELEGYPGVIASVLIRLGGAMLLEIAPDEEAFREAIAQFGDWCIEDSKAQKEDGEFREAEQSEVH